MFNERSNQGRESSEKTNKIILTLSNVFVSKGDKEILNSANLNIRQGEHAALVGPNGVGKTTLLEVITGEEQPDNGSVLIVRGLNIAYVPQSVDNIFPKDEDHTIFEYFLHSKGLDSIQKRMHEIESMFAQKNTATEALLTEYGELQTAFQDQGGYSIESNAKMVMEGIGLVGEIGLETSIAKLSGGEKTKLFLAQALISDADLLLLDEPSNHLDQDSVKWLSSYLRNYRGAMLVISHKPDFLKTFTEKVIEISAEDRSTFTYEGDYSAYLKQKAQRDQDREKTATRTDAEVARLQEVANRLRAGDRSNQSKDRQRKIEKIQADRPTKKKKEKVVKSAFEVGVQSGHEVLKTTNLIKKYGTRVLDYSNINIDLLKGEKVAIIGPVGAGKSTLLKIVAGIVQPDSGAFKLGHNVDIGYYSQEMEDLDVNKNIFDELRAISVGQSDQQIRNLLGSFLFSGDDVFKQISVLSYGERSRVMLAKLALRKHNFLVLDEPSNHLDTASRNIIASKLKEYEGTILLVSHDEEFMQGVGLNKVITLPSGKTKQL